MGMCLHIVEGACVSSLYYIYSIYAERPKVWHRPNSLYCTVRYSYGFLVISYGWFRSAIAKGRYRKDRHMQNSMRKLKV